MDMSQLWASVNLYKADSQYWQHEADHQYVSDKQALDCVLSHKLEEARHLAS